MTAKEYILIFKDGLLAIGEHGLESTTYEESYIYRDMRSFVSNVPLIQHELGLLD